MYGQQLKPPGQYPHQAEASDVKETNPAELIGANGDSCYRFGRFQLEPGTRSLLRDGRPVELGSRAFDLLVVLLKSRGTLVTKEEIVKHVWPSLVVEESNLRFQMASLRKALGDDRDAIKTIPGRGYLFAAEVAAQSDDKVAASQIAPLTTALPSPTQHSVQTTTVPATGHNMADASAVVVIDDDSDTREAIGGLLRSAGLEVKLFASVQAFVESDGLSPPACIVLDVLLPGQSGLDFQGKLAAAGIQTPVIFISGYADVHMSVRAMKAGAFDFLTKPIRHEEFLNAIERAIVSPHRGEASLDTFARS